MFKNKREWPEHTSWLARNEFKINVVLWASFFGLLIIARGIFTNKQVSIEVAVIWIAFFALDLFLLWITAESPFK